jgi:hypothetical protein
LKDLPGRVDPKNAVPLLNSRVSRLRVTYETFSLKDYRMQPYLRNECMYCFKYCFPESGAEEDEEEKNSD